MPTVEEIRWLAAWLEREGSFCLVLPKDRAKRIYLYANSIDLDIIQKVASILGTKAITMITTRTSIRYDVRVTGAFAIQWMMTIYFLMGIRRKKQIRKCINHWKQDPIFLKPKTILRIYANSRS